MIIAVLTLSLKINDMEKELFKDDANIGNDFKSYWSFHMANRGKHFLCLDGTIKSKLIVYCDHKDFPETLRNITLGKNKNYIPVDKRGWVNGVLQNR